MYAWEKRALYQEIKIYEECPTAFNMYIAGILRREIGKPYDKEFISKYGQHVRETWADKKLVKLDETYKEWKERNLQNGR